MPADGRPAGGRGLQIDLADVVTQREARQRRVPEPPVRDQLDDEIPTVVRPWRKTRIAPTPSGGGSPGRSSSNESIGDQRGQVDPSASNA